MLRMMDDAPEISSFEELYSICTYTTFTTLLKHRLEKKWKLRVGNHTHAGLFRHFFQEPYW